MCEECRLAQHLPAASAKMTSAHPPGAGAPSKQENPPLEFVALLGRLDQPTDGVRDYCVLLSQAFARRGARVDVVQLRWENDGWAKTLRSLWRQSRDWKNRFVFFQYTALTWSRRGFPVGALAVLAILKWRGVRLGVVFHDVRYESPRGALRRFRVAFQNFVIRLVYRCAELPVLTVPATHLSWLPRDTRRAVFIPVGANFPTDGPATRATRSPTPAIAVFGVTGGANTEPEVRDIAYAIKRVAATVPHLRLVAFGRNTLESEAALRRGLAGTNVELSVSGVLPAEEVRERLAESDVLLFVRGHISSRRGSAIAGIVCGLPVVGYRGAETAPPISEAGVLLVDQNDRDALAEALIRVLTDVQLYRDLHERNLVITAKYLSWDAIADQFARAMANASHES
jgi:glycosyltransferase involved in cell wall biosynthesis